MSNETTFEVNNFIYNGFYGKVLKGKAPFTATFSKWTNDPGIAKCNCSDGKERLIPSFALIGFSSKNFLKQEYLPSGPDLIGLSCKSSDS